MSGVRHGGGGARRPPSQVVAAALTVEHERFTALAERGLLHVSDPLLAAEHSNWLILAVPMNRALFTGIEEPAERLHYYADEAVRVFLAAYGTTRN